MMGEWHSETKKRLEQARRPWVTMGVPYHVWLQQQALRVLVCPVTLQPPEQEAG